jgi:hypothetical protein
MSLLIYSGLLYLAGISIILILRPQLMFAKDGNWKEFGLGRNKDKYTWMPFWLFAIMWAIISYIIVLVVASNTGLGGVTNNTNITVQNKNMESMMTLNSKKRATTVTEMKPGYYILNTNETLKRGVPKYVYLGPEAPNLVYHNTTSEAQGESFEDSMVDSFEDSVK